MDSEHSISVRDMRVLLGDPEIYIAYCRCGWTGVEKPGHTGERDARWDGRITSIGRTSNRFGRAS